MKKYLYKDSIKLHFVVLIWGFAAILGRLVTMPSVEIVFYRVLLSAIALFVILRIRGFKLTVSRADLVRVLGIGSIMGIHWIFFFASVKVSTVSVCLAGMATTSLWTSILEPILFKRKIALHEVILGIVVIVGILTIFHFESGYWLGLLFAVISAFLAALFIVLNAQISRRYHHHLITYYEMIGACLVIVLILPFYSYYYTSDGLDIIPTGMDWIYLIILALVCTVYGWSEYVELMKRLTPFSVNLALNLEPIYGILFAVIIFGDSEKMNLGFYFGAFIILAAIFIYPMISKKSKRIFRQQH